MTYDGHAESSLMFSSVSARSWAPSGLSSRILSRRFLLYIYFRNLTTFVAFNTEQHLVTGIIYLFFFICTLVRVTRKTDAAEPF